MIGHAHTSGGHHAPSRAQGAGLPQDLHQAITHFLAQQQRQLQAASGASAEDKAAAAHQANATEEASR